MSYQTSSSFMIISIIIFVLIVLQNSLVSSTTSSKSFPQFLGGFCNANSQCSVNKNVVCGGEKCICKLGHEADSNGIDCRLFKCSNTTECQNRFGLDSNLVCNSHYLVCECDQSFEADFHTQKCVAAVPALGENCASKWCSHNAVCGKNDKCICRFGFVPSLNKVNCHPLECYYDKECDLFGVNSTYCKEATSCECKSDYWIDDYTQTCVDSHEPLGGGTVPLWRNVVLIVLGGLILISFVVALFALLMIYKRRNAFIAQERSTVQQPPTVPHCPNCSCYSAPPPFPKPPPYETVQTGPN